MNENLMMGMALAAGAVLGTFFFVGLWWTVQRGLASKNPAPLFLGSFVLRMGVTLLGFYLIADGRWERMLLCLLGFIAARFVVTRLTGASAAVAKTLEGHHAP